MEIQEWYAVVEPQEYPHYASVIPKSHIITLPVSAYKAEYDSLDNLGLTKSTGPGPARNFIWDTAIQMGYSWHWVMDDNIRLFYRVNNNKRHEILSGAFFRAMEDFVLRYENVGMAGPNYKFFAPTTFKLPPLVFNTRIYSCNLIRNDIPYRWRGRYNEDTILSLDMLKDGWCTVQFNAFQQEKMKTQSVKGGNDKVFYSLEGTEPKSQMLADTYPQYARLMTKYGRPHHYVDYRSHFKGNKLIRRLDANIPQDAEYGLQLVKVK